MAVTKDKLKTYRKRRNLRISPEPKGSVSQKKITGGRTFVIQKHQASHTHYDFRLSIGGVLKSWAIPKGPSRNQRDKRLAVVTDDHPLSYAKFEGVIPEGSYGAGTVMVWDKGTYRAIKKENGRVVPIDECYKNGVIEIFLKGKKLHGAYALIRTQLHGSSDNWLLVKMHDEYTRTAKIVAGTADVSAVTGRTMKEITVQSTRKTVPKKSKR